MVTERPDDRGTRGPTGTNAPRHQGVKPPRHPPASTLKPSCPKELSVQAATAPNHRGTKAPRQQTTEAPRHSGTEPPRRRSAEAKPPGHWRAQEPRHHCFGVSMKWRVAASVLWCLGASGRLVPASRAILRGAHGARPSWRHVLCTPRRRARDRHGLTRRSRSPADSTSHPISFPSLLF